MEQTNEPVVQLSMEQLNAMFSNMAGEISKQLGMDKVDRKYGVFPGLSEKEMEGLTKDQKLRIWLKSVVQGDAETLARIKTTLSYTSTAGLGFVPEEFRTEVIRVAELYGVARRYAYVFPTNVATINLNSLASGLTAYWITDQTSAITRSEPVYAEPTIAVEACATISAVANELLEDATFPVVNHVAELAGEAIAYAEDYQMLRGTGSPFHGILGTVTGQVTVTSTANSYANFTPEDLLDLPMGVAAKYRMGGAYFMHPTVLASLTKSFKDSMGGFLLRNPREDGLATTIWGYPVIESETMPSTDAANTKFIAFANPKRCFFADRQSMSLDVSRDGYVAASTAVSAFEQNLSLIRVIERVGLGWTLGAGTAVLKTAAA